MKAEKLRVKDRVILWSAAAMSLAPLIPYAMYVGAY